jgi:hypothetical protein
MIPIPRASAFSPLASSCFREAGEVVSGDVAHAPDEAFSTAWHATGPESDGRAAGPDAGFCPPRSAFVRALNDTLPLTSHPR